MEKLQVNEEIVFSTTPPPPTFVGVVSLYGRLWVGVALAPLNIA
jgi:hypothetical protein